MSDFKEKFFKAIADAYPGEFPVDIEQANEDFGDGLAVFIRRELEEVIDWDRQINVKIFYDALQAMDKAGDDLAAIIRCLAGLYFRETSGKSQTCDIFNGEKG